MERILSIYKKHRPYFIAGGIIFGIGAVILLIRPWQQLSKERIEETRAACANLKVPDSFQKVNYLQIEKSEAAVYALEYKSDEQIERIDAHFIEQLEPSGWNHEFVKDHSDTSQLVFQKNGIKIEVNDLGRTIWGDRQIHVVCSVQRIPDFKITDWLWKN
jgi:hypothetical protein